MIGKGIVQAFSSPSMVLSITMLSNTTTFDDIVNQVDFGSYNGAFVVNADASANLLAALAAPSAHYNPAAATTFIFDEGRGGSSMASILRGALPPLAVAVGRAISEGVIASKGAAPLAAFNRAALLTPVGNTEMNLHPVQARPARLAAAAAAAACAATEPCHSPWWHRGCAGPAMAIRAPARDWARILPGRARGVCVCVC